MSTEAAFNPFRPDGELSREAEIIIKNSTILRDKVIINDPSLKPPENGISRSSDGLPKTEPILPENGSAPLLEGSPIRTGEVVSGRVSSPLSGAATNAIEPEQPMLQVEHVNIKSGPSKCCVVL